MENIIGLYTDDRPLNTPEGGKKWAFAKNILISKGFKSLEIEEGFIYQDALLKPVIGYVVTDRGVLYFCTNNNASDIVFVNNLGGTNFITSNNTDLGFRCDYPIEGVFKYNSKGQLIVAFTDNFNSIKVINVDNPPSPFVVNKLNLFPNINLYNVEKTILNEGGSLLAGSYSFSIKYYNKDGNETGWLTKQSPMFITESSYKDSFDNFKGSEGRTVTNKAISITINHNGNEISFDSYKIAVLATIDGVKSAYIIQDGSLLSTTHFTFTGSENLENIDITELLVENSTYSTCKSLASFKGDLYLANVKKRTYYDYQKYANNIKIKWVAELVDLTNDENTSKRDKGNRLGKSFMPREVYAFYFYFINLDGTHSPYYHVPGIEPGDPSYILPDPNAVVGRGFDSAPYLYQVDDCIDTSSINLITADIAYKGDMSYWENVTENYDVNADVQIWDALGDTGNNINDNRTNVRHHRFPSLKFLKEHVFRTNDDPPGYANGVDTEFGLSKDVKLGISVEDVFIPDSIKQYISGWGIAYAKRSVSNMTVLGQDVLLYTHEVKDLVTTNSKSSFSSIGMNVNMKLHQTNTAASGELLTINNQYGRGHSPDLMFSQLPVSPDYFANEIRYQLIPTTAFTLGNASLLGTSGWEYGDLLTNVLSIDVTRRTTDDEFTATTDYLSVGTLDIVAIEDFNYIPNNVRLVEFLGSAYTYYNYFRESFIHYKFKQAKDLLISVTGATASVFEVSQNPSSTTPTFTPDYTISTALEFNKISFCKIRDVVYSDYNGLKDLITIDSFVDKDTTSATLFIGDVFLCTPTITTHIRTDESCYIVPSSLHKLRHDTIDSRYLGTYIAYVLPMHCVHNWNLRHTDDTDDLTKFFPDTVNLKSMNPGWEDFKLLYNLDYTEVNDYNTLINYTFDEDEVTHLPFLIHKGIGKTPQKDYGISWATFLPLEYLILDTKDKGEITKVLPYNNTLLIHQKNTLVLAQLKDRFSVETHEIYLGQGDVFDRSPQEIAPVNLGYTGNQSRFATTICKLGYVFIDRALGKVFSFNGSLNEISNKNISNFLRDNLNYDYSTDDEDIDNPFMQKGLLMVYDNRWDRLLISKREYDPLFSFTDDNNESAPTSLEHAIDDYIRWKGRFYKVVAGLGNAAGDPTSNHTPSFKDNLNVDAHGEPLNERDGTLFLNKSWTLSYYPFVNNGIWCCFHDYYPNVLVATRTELFCILNTVIPLTDNDFAHMYKMNQPYTAVRGGVYLEQSGLFEEDIIYPSFIDFIFNRSAGMVKYLMSVVWNTDIIKDGVLNNELTFDSITIYNDSQCSGEVTINVSDFINKNATNQKGNWHFNQFNDLVKDKTLAFIDSDKELIVSNIDNSKAFFDKSPFISKFVIVRVKYNNIEAQQILYINDIEANFRPSKFPIQLDR